jgi:membrane-associated protein
MILEISSATSYVIAVVVPALDVLIPVLPSESAVIALGAVTAGSADPRIALLVGLAAFGAFLGDNVAYLAGRRFGPAVDRRLFAGERGARRRDWARRSLDQFGVRVIIVCRFIPGGRTAVTLTCGLIGYPVRTFRAATACAGVLWACYAFFLGRLGGKLFEDRPWLGLLLALGLALGVSVLTEAGRRVWRRYRSGHAEGRADGSAVPAGQLRRDGEADAATGGPGGRLTAPEPVEDARQVTGRDPNACADDFQHAVATAAPGADRDAASGRGELQRVGGQVGDDPVQPAFVGEDRHAGQFRVHRHIGALWSSAPSSRPWIRSSSVLFAVSIRMASAPEPVDFTVNPSRSR